VQCPGSLFEQASFLFLEAVVLILYQRRLGHNQGDVLDATRIWNKKQLRGGRGSTIPALPSNSLPSPVWDWGWGLGRG